MLITLYDAQCVQVSDSHIYSELWAGEKGLGFRVDRPKTTRDPVRWLLFLPMAPTPKPIERVSGAGKASKA